MAERDLVVRFIGDDRSLQQAFNRTERRTKQFDTRTQRLGAGLTRAFGAAGITIGGAAFLSGANQAVQAASALNEEMSKSRQVFGAAADSVLEWSETTARSMGISQTAALQATGTFGNLFRVVGITGEASAEMSKELVQLAADMASFNNASPEDVLLAIRSGLIGEAEPLRRYGVLLSETRVQQLALADTGKENVKSLTNQEKALARYKIILQDTAPAQGDFARTSDSLANKQRIAAAESQELATKIGTGLAPAMDIALTSTIGLVGGINDLIDAMGDLHDLLRNSDFAQGWNEAMGSAGAAVVDFGKDVRDQIPFMEHFLDLRNRFAGVGSEPGASNFGDRFPAPFVTPPDERARRERALRATAGQEAIDRIARQAAAAQASLNRQLADSEKRAAHLRDLIRAEPANETLQKRLRAELDKQASLRRQIAADAKSAAAADKAAADEARRMADEEKRAADEAARRRRENQIAARQSRQFRALGLTATGEQRVPGVGALRRRLGTLRDQIQGTALDTDKTDAQLDRIGKVLSGKFGKVGRDVREAILQMFATIAGALEDGGETLKGPLTKTSGLVTSKIAEGLGLTPEQERALRAKLSHFNTGGLAPAGGQNRSTGGGFVGGQAFVIDNEVTVIIDGQKLTTTVTKQQQKARRRNPKQKRGPNRTTGGV